MDPTLGEVVSTLLLEVSEPSLQGGERVSPPPAEEASLEPGALRFETALGEFSSEQVYREEEGPGAPHLAGAPRQVPSPGSRRGRVDSRHHLGLGRWEQSSQL